MSASLPGVSEPTLSPSFRSRAPFMVAQRSTSRVVASGGRLVSAGPFSPSARPLMNMRCSAIAVRIWVKKSAVSVHSTSVDSDGWKPRSSAFWIGGVPWRMFISIGTASETPAPASLRPRQAKSDMPVMWMKRLSAPKAPALASASKVGRMPKVPTMCAATGRPSSRPIAHAAS